MSTFMAETKAWIWPTIIVSFCLRWGHMMGTWGFWDWVSYGGIVIAAIFIAVDAAIAQSATLGQFIARPFQFRFFAYVPLLAVMVSAGAFVKKELSPRDFLLPQDAKIGSPFGIEQGWGVSNDAFYMVIRTGQNLPVSATKRVMLIVRPTYANFDRMTDRNILKSQSYTINRRIHDSCYSGEAAIALGYLQTSPP